MKVTKLNYEEHALDYLEGTLSGEERQAFERFLDENPEIAAEVRGLGQQMPVLVPDLSVRYPDKTALRRKAPVRLWVVRITAVAAAAVVGVLLLNHRPQESPVTVGPSMEKEVAEAINHTPTAPDGETGKNETGMVLADAAVAPVKSVVKTPDSAVQPTVDTGSGHELKSDAASVTPVQPKTRSTSSESSESRQKEEQIREIREVITVVAPVRTEQPVTTVKAEISELKAEDVHLAQAPTVHIVSVSEEMLIKPTGEPLLARDTRDYFSEENDQAGFLNVVNRRGMRRIASGILTPLSSLSPIKVYETNEERVVEFASITISRKSNKSEE